MSHPNPDSTTANNPSPTISLDGPPQYRTLSPSIPTPTVGITTFQQPETYRGTIVDNSHNHLPQSTWQTSLHEPTEQTRKELYLTLNQNQPNVSNFSSSSKVKLPQSPSLTLSAIPATIDSTYSFLSTTNPTSLLNVITSTLCNLGADCTRHPSKPKINAIKFDSQSQSLLSIWFTLFQDDKDSLICCEVQKRHGSAQLFHSFYTSLFQQLSPHIQGTFNGQPVIPMNPISVLPSSGLSLVDDDEDHELDRLVMHVWRAYASDRVRDACTILTQLLTVSSPSQEDLSYALTMILNNLTVVDSNRQYLSLLLLKRCVNDPSFVQSKIFSERCDDLVCQLVRLVNPSQTTLNQTLQAISSIASHSIYSPVFNKHGQQLRTALQSIAASSLDEHINHGVNDCLTILA